MMLLSCLKLKLIFQKLFLSWTFVVKKWNYLWVFFATITLSFMYAKSIDEFLIESK